jgi:nucleotide-binding universal stress UspA family protein
MMSYKTIMVHLDASKQCDDRIRVALQLGKAHAAHVIGFYAVYEPMLPVTEFSWDGGGLREHFAQRQEARREAFLALAQPSGLTVEWRAYHPTDTVAPTAHLRHADLLIAGQRDPADFGGLAPDGFMTDLLFGSARPVLMLPNTGAFTMPARHVAIAWDASRSAARATADALPLLRDAAYVTVINAYRPYRRKMPEPQLADVAAYLDDHRVKAHITQIECAPATSTGNTLLEQLAKSDANMLVMGAYAHSRMREIVLGGVTRTVLKSTPLPVLLSH